MKGLDKSFFAKVEQFTFYLLVILLPTQLGKHFWPEFSLVNGIRVDFLSPTLYVTDVLILLLLVFWLMRRISSLRIRRMKQSTARFVSWWGLSRRFAPRKDVVVFSFVIGYLIINILLSTNIPGGFYSLLKFLEFSFVAFYVAGNIGKSVSLVTTTVCFSIGVMGESLLTIIQYVLQGSVGGLLYLLGERTFSGSTPGIANASLSGELILRPYGTLPHPNVLAGYLLVSMILIFAYLFPDKTHWKKSLAAAALLLGSSALLLTLSRVAIVLWVVFLIWVFSKKLKHIGTFFMIVVLVSVFFLHTLAPRFLETTLAEEAFTQRALLNEAAVGMVLQNPIIGIGFGNFLRVLPDFQSPLSLGLYLQPVHNIFLLVLTETGIIGFGIFLWFLLTVVTRLIRSKNTPLLWTLSCILILGLFDHYWLTLQQGQLLFTLILGIILVRKPFHNVPFR